MEFSTAGQHKPKVNRSLRIYRKVLIIVFVLVALSASADFAYSWYNNIYAGTPMTVTTYKLAEPAKQPASNTPVKPNSSTQR
jgi:hypothetical protein